MIAMRWRLLAPLLGLLAAAGGCGSPPYVQVETEVHGDGSCDRTIWQPEGELLPPEARRPEWSERWSSVRPILAPPAFAGKVGKGGDRTYFTAVGSFRDPGEIPIQAIFDRLRRVGKSEILHRSTSEVSFELE